MKYIALLISILSLVSCKGILLNAGLKAMGIYDDVAEMHTTSSDSKTIVLLPTHHLGTPAYYDDLHRKIDSLAALNYFFYIEKIEAQDFEYTILRKFRKFSGNPIPSGGYKMIFDSIIGKNVKLKKEIIDQPSYLDLGVPIVQSENVDATLAEVINYYETKYGEIKLEPCDFETLATEETTCTKLKISKEIRNDVIQDYRNNIVLNRVDVETRDKIVIIYGDAHTSGILKGLKERGYQLNE